MRNYKKFGNIDRSINFTLWLRYHMFLHGICSKWKARKLISLDTNYYIWIFIAALLTGMFLSFCYKSTSISIQNLAGLTIGKKASTMASEEQKYWYKWKVNQHRLMAILDIKSLLPTLPVDLITQFSGSINAHHKSTYFPSSSKSFII